jgi:4-aminobutyrate aminotransferase-like enzyme
MRGIDPKKDICGLILETFQGWGAILFQDPLTGEPDRLIASKIAEECYEKGLLLVHIGRESIKLGPPFRIADEALIEAVDALTEALKNKL